MIKNYETLKKEIESIKNEYKEMSLRRPHSQHARKIYIRIAEKLDNLLVKSQ